MAMVPTGGLPPTGNPWIEGAKVVANVLGIGSVLFGGGGDEPDYDELSADQLRRTMLQYRRAILSNYLRRIAALNPTLATNLINNDVFKGNFLALEKYWQDVPDFAPSLKTRVEEVVKSISQGSLKNYDPVSTSRPENSLKNLSSPTKVITSSPNQDMRK